MFDLALMELDVSERLLEGVFLVNAARLIIRAQEDVFKLDAAVGLLHQLTVVLLEIEQVVGDVNVLHFLARVDLVGLLLLHVYQGGLKQLLLLSLDVGEGVGAFLE